MLFGSGARPRRQAALSLVVALGAAIPLAGCSPKPVAVVGGQKLTEAEFAHLCETATQVTQQGGTVGMQVLIQWIQSTILAQEAKAQGVYPSQADLDARLDSLRKQAAFVGANFEQQLAQRGLSVETLKRDLLNGMIQDNLLLKGVTVTEDEMKKAFEEQKKSLTIQEQIRISQVTVESEEQAKKVLSDLATGTNFGIVASTYSKDRYAQNKGEVPFPITKALPPGGPVAKETVQAAFRMKEGQTSDAIKIGETWVVVRVDQRIPEKVPSLEDVRELIRTQLRQKKARDTAKIQENERSLRQAFSTAKPEIFRAEYKALAQMTQAPGTPGAPGVPQPVADGHEGHDHGAPSAPAGGGGATGHEGHDHSTPPPPPSGGG